MVECLTCNEVVGGFDSSPKLMNNLYIYVFAGFVIMMYLPVFYQIYMLRKMVKSLNKKTEKLVD